MRRKLLAQFSPKTGFSDVSSRIVSNGSIWHFFALRFEWHPGIRGPLSYSSAVPFCDSSDVSIFLFGSFSFLWAALWSDFSLGSRVFFVVHRLSDRVGQNEIGLSFLFTNEVLFCLDRDFLPGGFGTFSVSTSYCLVIFRICFCGFVGVSGLIFSQCAG